MIKNNYVQIKVYLHQNLYIFELQLKKSIDMQKIIMKNTMQDTLFVYVNLDINKE